MRYLDQHIHSDCSPDSETPRRQMAEAARDHGMSAICFTDHVDMDIYETGLPGPNYPACWPAMMQTRQELLENPVEGIEVRFGIELGEAHHNVELSQEIVAHPELDIVLGSLHNLRATPDFYWYPYKTEEECGALNKRYMLELIELADFPGFDIMAHIGYTSRYMRRKGFQTRVSLEEYYDEYKTLLTKLISQGRGIEVNCQGLREGDTTYAIPQVLALYKELGGEVITVGSDGHDAQAASIGVKEGYALLESLGYKYVAEFVQRKPTFNKIG